MVEPVFDPIKAAVIMCGAIPRYIPLRTRPDVPPTVFHSDNLYIDSAEVVPPPHPMHFILSTSDRNLYYCVDTYKDFS
jgi:hypothetical protein